MATTRQLAVTATPAGGGSPTTVTSNADTTYVSSDEEVATVSSGGLITAVAEGTATVTASYHGGSGTCAVTVNGAS